MSDEINSDEVATSKIDMQQKHLSDKSFNVIDLEDNFDDTTNVVHLENTSKSSNFERLNPVDVIFDSGKTNSTGPCFSGSRRVDNGACILEEKVILITASGNFWGLLSFNGKEIYFASIFDEDNDLNQDSAAVTLSKQIRMRRRRWVVSAWMKSSFYFLLFFQSYLQCQPYI
jgi:hypothetical protein